MNLLIEHLTENPLLFYLLVGLLSLMVGSFLNVVIHRLPQMMAQDWKSQCRELLELPPADAEPAYNLITPRSCCPHCQQLIRWWENIPLLSYLRLRGRCAHCQNPISLRYPLVELTTMLLSLVVAWQLGAGLQAIFLILLTWALVALSLIDLDHQLLPDSITLPFLWLGLLLGIPGIFLSAEQALIGAATGYLSLWSFYWLFKLLTGKEGMGYGDFKLLALFGAWAGWSDVFVIILLSSMVGAIAGVGLILFKGHDRRVPIPFGPYIALAGWITLLWGDQITGRYLQFAGLA
jgi:leader peptidase (prepilin peptidase)/N-methyltransferase